MRTCCRPGRRCTTRLRRPRSGRPTRSSQQRRAARFLLLHRAARPHSRRAIAMTRTLNVGLIGAGFMGKAHSLAYAAMPMFFWPAPAIPQRKLIAEVTDELAQEAAARFGYERATSDWRAVVDDPEIDLVDIAVPNDAHAEIAIAAAEAGKHILCEKPLARTAGEARAMLDAVERAGVVHMVAFNYRRTPAVALA